MKKQMTGDVYVSKVDKSGSPKELVFTSVQNGEYVLAKNCNWERLKDLGFETIDAVGVVYVEASGNRNERRRVFKVQRFSMKGTKFQNQDDFFDPDSSDFDSFDSSDLVWVDESFN